MDKIPLSDADIVSLDHVAPGLSGLRILFVNLFGIDDGNGTWTLVDAGLQLSASRIRGWADEHFGKGVPPESILLTHGHFDHVGALDELLKDWKVPVYAHATELPYITGKEKYPPPDTSVGGGLMALMSWAYPRGPINIGQYARPLPDDGSVPGLPDWQSIRTPGHTRGHVSFFRQSDRVLIVGDAFCTTKQESLFAVASQRPELHGPPAYYTPDWAEARESVRLLADLHPAVIAPGHGQPMAGPDTELALHELAENFDRIARPQHGKYSEPVKAER